jgi:predicted nucleotidyltransferase
VDSRGAATKLVEDPRGQCELLAGRAGIALPNITAAREHTRARVRELKDALSESELASGMSVCVFGSWAREELTPESDDDWAVLVAEPFSTYNPDVVSAMAIAQRRLGADEQAPGTQGIFGVPFDLEGLVKNIGLDGDSNTNLTRRMLLLLESRELAGDVHEQAWQTVLERYMNYGVKPFRPPRFLLNDLTRYWRTICVDFEGKHQNTQGEDAKWVSRNAKLRTSRKLLFAGGLVPIMLCHLHGRDAMVPFLSSWLKAPALDRLAAAFSWAEAEAEGARALLAYDRWLAIQRDSDARRELRALRHDNRRSSELFNEITEIGRQFQRAVLALLFETRLSALSQQYVVF